MPGDFVVNSVRFACGQWAPEPPDRDRALLDVYFGRRTSEDPEDRPRSESLEAVERLGGVVVHSFNLPMARVILDVSRVAKLDANFVDGVPDAEIRGAKVIVRIATPLTDSDRDFFELVGAKVLGEYGFFATAWVPDESIAAVRSYSGVGYVEVDGVACADVPPN